MLNNKLDRLNDNNNNNNKMCPMKIEWTTYFFFHQHQTNKQTNARVVIRRKKFHTMYVSYANEHEQK